MNPHRHSDNMHRIHAILAAAQPTPTTDPSYQSEDNINWTSNHQIFTLCILLLFVSFFGCLSFYWQRYRSIKGIVLAVYPTLPQSEKDKIAGMVKEIEKELDPNIPGRCKYLRAWKGWLEADCMSLEGSSSTSSTEIIRSRLYPVTLHFLSEAEIALEMEKETGRIEDSVKAVEALELAAMVRAIYWPYEVARANAKRNKVSSPL